jgi:hypothetical protein
LEAGVVTKQYRWICPKCDAGKNAPSRLRKIDVRRYCLSCSEREGILIERIVPKFETKREAAKKRAQAKAARKRAKDAPKRQAIAAANRATRKRLAALKRFERKFTIVSSDLPGPGWHRIGSPDLNQYRHVRVTVHVHEDQFGRGSPQTIATYWVPSWAHAIMTMAVPAGKQDMIWNFIEWIALKKKLCDAVFAASVVKPIYGVLLAIDHYNEALPAGYKDMVRKLAGWKSSSDGIDEAFIVHGSGNRYALTLSGSP